MRKVKLFTWAALAGILGSGMVLSGCGASEKDNEKTKIEMVQYKPEAVKAFEKMEEKFNASHALSYTHLNTEHIGAGAVQYNCHIVFNRI